MLYFTIEYLHVLGAIVILGTGAGIAFFMLMAHRTGDAAFIARTAEVVVLADFVFTLSAVLLQPVTGGLLMWLSSTSITEGWLMTSLVLYAVAGVSGSPWCSCKSKCAILRGRRSRKARRCRRATSPCFAAGSCSAFPASVRSWRSSG
jgi:uncharacterized membrane protein